MVKDNLLRANKTFALSYPLYIANIIFEIRFILNKKWFEERGCHLMICTIILRFFMLEFLKIRDSRILCAKYINAVRVLRAVRAYVVFKCAMKKALRKNWQ
jgi:hypothetical protein